MAETEPKIAKAALKNLDIAPRKVRSVAGLLKGKSTVAALAQLQMLNKRSSQPLVKLIKSAVANAREKNMDPGRLQIDEVRVDKGRVLKRALPKGRGRVSLLERKYSHVNLVLRENSALKAPGYTIHERPKKVKETTAPREPKKEKFKDKKRDEVEVKKKPGLAQRFFRRKSI